MKYSQLVHMSRDVKHWLEQQLEALGIDRVLYTNYLINLVEGNTLCLPPGLDNKKKRDIETLLIELCAKLKGIENSDSSDLEILSEYLANNLTMDPNLGFSYKLNNSMNCIEPIQPCLPPNSAWTRGLLHDSSSESKRDKMDDYFSTLFYDNPADVLGFEFVWNETSDGRKPKGTETDRINFYNKQNLLASECSERLYERNADIDKLIAKFDANIEDIWKTSSKTEHLNMKYHTLFSQDFFSNPYLQYDSNVIWAFEQNEREGQPSGNPEAGCGENPAYKSFSTWNKFSSPALTTANNFDAMMSAFNVTLSNVQKWSSTDGQNGTSNILSNRNQNGSCFAEVIPKGSTNSGGQRNGLPYISENPQAYQEDEDLLTSAKTHFRPIRAEELGGSQSGIYADGTTFAISNDLEKVSFKRSESGALYLEADANTPRKYMEFKEKEGGGGSGGSGGGGGAGVAGGGGGGGGGGSGRGDCEIEVSAVGEFVPKFRVRQSNEKFCQTDDIDDEQMVPTMNETDVESVSSDSEEDEFYFPGDEELAQNITNSIDERPAMEGLSDCNYNSNACEAHESKMDILEMSLYKMAETKKCFCNSGKDWSVKEDASKKQEWSQIWDTETSCDNCKTNSGRLSAKDKFLFREELTQEGEQLLSDLSCLQQMYSNADWCDDDSITASDLNEEEVQNSIEEVVTECFPPGIVGDLEKGGWWRLLMAKNGPVTANFDLSSLWKEENNSSNPMENDKSKFKNETNERPFIADALQTERKRRNSSSQRACTLYMEGQCRRPHCRFAHCDSAIPCPFFADASCMKGESCPLSHGVRRPLSL